MPSQNSFDENAKTFLEKNFKTSELGLIRISRNLGLVGLADTEIIDRCRKIIQSTPIDKIETRGKNYYLHSQEYSSILTINRSSLGIITAKRHR
jgi:hypothetical protein